MLRSRIWRALLLAHLFGLVSALTGNAQVFSAPTSTGRFGNLTSLDSIQTVKIDSNVFLINGQRPNNSTPLQAPSGSISKLDLKSPAKARREYEKGYQFLMKKDLEAAIAHLTKSIAVYPGFVAAHNALGTAFLNQGQNQQAYEQFSQAVALDDHLPNSYLNLGCAELALDQYDDAEKSLKKASSIAPLDVQLLTALTYAEFVNRDYPAVITTARQVHESKHGGSALVHYFAAGALDAQGRIADAQREMETLLSEDPNSPSIPQYRKILDQLLVKQAHLNASMLHPADIVAPPSTTAIDISRRVEQALQDKKEEFQIAEAEAEPDPTCFECRPTPPLESGTARSFTPLPGQPQRHLSTSVLRLAVDEVAIFFAATDRGRSVVNLAASDVRIRDNNQPPNSILAFHNESDLPLRFGLIIDTSNSVTDRFQFEQKAAAKFLETVLTHKEDLAFVIGVNNSVLVVQDFTADHTLIARAVSALAPGGGTALWDAVAFASDKLAKRPEIRPVARILVVISDGEDNSSKLTLKQAIAKAQQGEVAIYTVSTRDQSREAPRALIGDHALKTLSELTGGSASKPDSIHNLSTSLDDLQQVIRGRYLISYTPASFQLDGGYRPVEIKAEKEGHKLTVYARKGYYAASPQTGPANH
jgi:Ca-activated chloride channel homolog